MVTASLHAAASRAQDALRRSEYHSLRKLIAEETEAGEILISGNVSTFYQKQKAQELVRTVVDGITLVNDVEVS